MISRLLCRLGLHKWQVRKVRRLPAIVGYPNPRYIKRKCSRRSCGENDWDIQL